MAGLGRIIEGSNAIEAALESNRVIEIRYLKSNNKKSKFSSLLTKAEESNIKISELGNKTNWEYSTRHSIVAICEPVETYKESQLNEFKSSNFIVCDHIQDTNNLGAIARSAAAFNFGVLAVPLKRSVKLSDKVFSISSGGLEKVKILYYNSTFSLIKKLNSLDIWTIGLDADGTEEINDVNLGKQNIAIFLGPEETGLSSEVKNKLDIVCRIEMTKDMESLNVSAAAAIAMNQIFIKK